LKAGPKTRCEKKGIVHRAVRGFYRYFKSYKTGLIFKGSN